MILNSGSGRKYFDATLIVTVESGSTVTATFADIVLTGTSDGTVKFDIPKPGIWTVNAEKDSQSIKDNVNIREEKEYKITLTYDKTYTVRIALNNDNPETACEYMDDAIGMTPSKQGAWGGSWANTKLFQSIKPCIVKDGVFQYYLNKNNLAQKETGESVDITSINTGDVMIEIPKIGYRMWRDSQYQYVSVTTEQNKSNYCYLAHSLDIEGDCDKIYIGAFLGYNYGNKIYSLSDKTPVANLKLSVARNYAQTRGKGYSLVSFYPLVLLQCLYLIKYKNRDSQNALGKGWTYQNSITNTGGTIARGNDFGEGSGKVQMCFLNIEDVWGNIWWWIDGLTSTNTVNTAFNNFNDNASGYPYKVPHGLGSNTTGYISDIQGANNTGFLLRNVSGSQSTYYTDEGVLNRDGVLGYFGNKYNLKNRDGMFGIRVEVTSYVSRADIGCRLMFKHKKEV